MLNADYGIFNTWFKPTKYLSLDVSGDNDILSESELELTVQATF